MPCPAWIFSCLALIIFSLLLNKDSVNNAERVPETAVHASKSPMKESDTVLHVFMFRINKENLLYALKC